MYQRVKLTCIPNLSIEYEIDTNGVLYSKGRKGTEFRPVKYTDNGNGYLYFKLATGSHSTRRTYYIHRLVAMQFIPNPENKPTVNHIDGDKSNNNVNNLEWATKEEQEFHRKHILNRVNGYTIYCKNCKDNSIYKFDSIMDCAKFTQNDESKIRYALRHSGYTNQWWYSLTNEFPSESDTPKFHKRIWYAKHTITGECIAFSKVADIKAVFGSTGQIYKVIKGEATQSFGYYWSHKPFI